MKRAFIILLLTAVLGGLAFAAAAPKDPYGLQVKKLYSTPDENSNLIYSIPIDVKLLDISEDGNWYKVKIAYAFGPFSYTYVGWAEIPVGSILAARIGKTAKVASHNPLPKND